MLVQFFITYAKQPSLDGKYTIFGRVIDGADSTLDAMEREPVNAKSRPLHEITLDKVTIHANPVRPFCLSSFALVREALARLADLRFSRLPFLPARCPIFVQMIYSLAPVLTLSFEKLEPARVRSDSLGVRTAAKDERT